MSEHEKTRRTFLKWSTVGGTTALAGCSGFWNQRGGDGSESDNSVTEETPPVIEGTSRAIGPRSKRPENPGQNGYEYLVDSGAEEGALYVWRDDEWSLMDVYADNATFIDASGIHFADAFVNGGDGSSDRPWVVDGTEAMKRPGSLLFGEGYYTANQFRTDLDIDYEATTLYLRGTGIRSTTLQKPDFDASFIEFTLEDRRTGNFGGMSDMTVWGNNRGGPESKGHLVYSTGDIIDLTFENLIVRYGHHDGIHLSASASGTRLHNCWVENHGGWAVWLGGGTRAKVSDQHIVGCEKGGIRFNASTSQMNNVSTYECNPGIEMRSERTEATNLYFKSCRTAFRTLERSGQNKISNVQVDDAAVAIHEQGTNSQWSNVGVQNVDVGIRVDGSQNLFSHVDARNSTVVVNGDENIFANVVSGRVVDNGTRTVFNGRGTNDGNPNHSGEWNGHAEYAFRTGVTVWDTSRDQWRGYLADGNGNWLNVV